jgi:hypothetical protein
MINKTKHKTSHIIVKVTEKIRKKLNDYITSLETIFGFIVAIIY